MPAADRRPVDEFYDLTKLFYCIGGPQDIREPGAEGSTFLKYTMKEPTSKFRRKIEGADFVYYKCETRFSNG